MKTACNESISIVGAGMSGCFMAILLAKKGYQVDIYERYKDSRKYKIDFGRSFNLTLYYRGIQAFKKAGIWNEVKKVTTSIKGNVEHPRSRTSFFTSFTASDPVLYTVHRRDLNNVLLKVASSYSNISLHFEKKILSVDKNTNSFYVQDIKSKKIKHIRTDIIFGCDGVNSIVRNAIQEKENAKHIQEYSEWGYKEVHLKKELARKLHLRKNVTHTFSRNQALLIAFPNPDDSYTLMFNLPLNGINSFSTLKSKDTITNFIKNVFPELLPALKEIIKSLIEKPLGNFVSIYTEPWFYKNFLVLIGDAAHGVLPFYGQGMCAALEDCIIVNTLIDQYPNRWDTIFASYQAQRKKHTDVLADLSKDNFIRLRRNSTSTFSVLKDKVDTLLSKLIPQFWFPPLYMMIAHADLPYADAYNKRKMQQKLAWIVGLNFFILFITIPYDLINKIKPFLAKFSVSNLL